MSDDQDLGAREDDAEDAEAGGPDADGRPVDAPADDADAEEWKFDLDEVGVDGLIERRPIEPEAVSLESAVFVVLGAAATLALIARMAMLLA